MNNKRQKRPAAKKGVLGRVLKSLFCAYPKTTTFALFCITVNAVISSLPSIFMERVFTGLRRRDRAVHAYTYRTVRGVARARRD